MRKKLGEATNIVLEDPAVESLITAFETDSQANVGDLCSIWSHGRDERNQLMRSIFGWPAP